MAGPTRILIAGGYGVFGRLLARHLLARTATNVVVAGRDFRRAHRACQSLESAGRAEPLALDLRDLDAVARAAAGSLAVVCTAGPFQELPAGLPAVVVGAGAHWLDIADDPRWVLGILRDRNLHRRAAERGVVATTGLSCVPALSGAMARWCMLRLPDASRGRVTLFIGNRNSKGTAAIASALTGRFRDPVLVALPAGPRRAWRAESPDEEMLRAELGLQAEFRAALDWGSAGLLVAAIGRARGLLGGRTLGAIARTLSLASRPFGVFGARGGCLQVQTWNEHGSTVTLSALSEGQDLAVMPCGLFIETLLAERPTAAGVVHPVTWLPPEEWIRELHERGVRFLFKPGRPTARPLVRQSHGGFGRTQAN